MEEDVLGTHREIHVVDIVECARCGRDIPRRDAKLVSGELVPGARSEQAEICARCWEELKKGPDNPPR